MNSEQLFKVALGLVKTLPPDIDSLYEEAVLRQANISHYAQGLKEEGLSEGKAEGLAEGAAKLRAEKITIAKNLMNKGFAIEEITEITGLSVAELSVFKP